MEGKKDPVFTWCFQIFEIEDDLDIALDTGDYGPTPSVDAFRQRRISGISRRHTSERRVSSNEPSNPAGSPNKTGRRDLSPASPRQRLNSMLNRGAEAAQTFTSPLAQIFQPLVVDDEIPEDAEAPPSHPGIPNGVSYGPASRRRLSTMQRSPADSATVVHHRFPSMGSHHGSHEALSSDPDAYPTPREPETAEEVQEEASGMAQWAQRLQRLEEGQKRIEDLLIQLSKDKI
jgi:hypothetical protein